MRATAAFAVFTVVLVAAAAGIAQQTFRGGVQVVFVDASVTQGHRPVEGLVPTDFAVLDNGVLQRVDAVDSASIPLDVSFVVDAAFSTLGMTPEQGAAGSNALRKDVQSAARLLSPRDRLRVITFAAEVVETRIMSPVTGDATPVPLANPTTKAWIRRYRITEALLTALTAPVGSDRRHVVLLFARALGDVSVDPLENLSAVAKHADALLYAVLTPQRQEVGTHEPRPFYPSEVAIRAAVSDAAEVTGGKTFLTGDITGAFKNVLKEFRNSYMLRYTLQGPSAKGWHEIVVSVPKCDDCVGRARRGYVAE